MNLKNFVILNLNLGILLFLLFILLFSGIVFAIPNPASVYCKEVGGTIEINKTPLGEQGLCVINGERFDEWKFLEGKIGKKYSWCVKNGYGIETICDGKSPFSFCRAVCVFQNESKRDMGYLMNLYEKIYGKNVDPDKREIMYANSLATTPKFGGGKHIILQAQTNAEGNSEDGLPAYFDWRDVNGTNFMTDVKDQDGGGTCWAYSVVGTIEAKYNIEHNISNLSLHLNLSERNLASNNPECGCDYCGDYDKGGLLVSPYNYIKNVGITTEQCFPDTYSNSYPLCSERCPNWTENLYKIKDYGVFSTSNITYIKKMLIEKGPLTVGVYVDASGWWDDEGIIHCDDDFQWFTHGMVLVGYNDTDTGGYWILKNSWGKYWGHDGYAYIKYGNCLVESEVQKFAYPINVSLGNFSNESILCKDFVTVCKNKTCDTETIQEAIEKVCNGGKIFINDSVFNEEIEIVKDNIILDCNNTTIDGNKKGIGMWIIAKNTTVKNCIIKNFVYGIALDTSSNVKLINNTLISNNYGIYLYHPYGGYNPGSNELFNNKIFLNTYGIYVASNPYFDKIFNNEILNNTVGIFSSSNLISNFNNVCYNEIDFNLTFSQSNGDNNRCDNSIGWNDNGVVGCKISCNCKEYDFDKNNVVDIFDAVNALENLSTGKEIYNVNCKNKKENNLTDIFALIEKIIMENL